MHVEWILCCLACSYQAQIVLSAAFPGSLCVPFFWHQVLEANLIHFLALLEYSFVPATSAFICLWHAHELSHRQRKTLGKREVGRQARELGFPAVEWNQVLQRAWFLHQDPPAELAATHSMTSVLLAVPFLPCSSSLPGNIPFISFSQSLGSMAIPNWTDIVSTLLAMTALLPWWVVSWNPAASLTPMTMTTRAGRALP